MLQFMRAHVLLKGGLPSFSRSSLVDRSLFTLHLSHVSPLAAVSSLFSSQDPLLLLTAVGERYFVIWHYNWEKRHSWLWFVVWSKHWLFSHDSKVRNLNLNLKCAFLIKIRKTVVWTVCTPKSHRDVLFEMRNSNDDSNDGILDRVYAKSHCDS